MSALTGSSLCFSYGKREVLRDFSIEIGSGITGLVGPNGAGKTTILRILAGIVSPDGGELTFSGTTIDNWRSRSWLRSNVGFLPQDPQWSGYVKVKDFLAYCFSMNNGKRRVGKDRYGHVLNRALDLTNSRDFLDRKIGSLSGGERRRVYLASVLIHQPEIVILDEPTVGLDPSQRVDFRNNIAQIADVIPVVISTHIIEDLRGIAHSIILIDHGSNRWNGTPSDLAKLGQSGEGITDLEAGYLELVRD